MDFKRFANLEKTTNTILFYNIYIGNASKQIVGQKYYVLLLCIQYGSRYQS